MATAAELAARLDRATEDRRLLEHPFYKAWAAGTLEREDLRYYATQYWRQVEAFPGYLETIASRLPASKPKNIVLDNLADERDGDHAGLWLDFAAAMGAGDAEVKASLPSPETRATVDAFREAAADRSEAFALGMIYGYESQTPAVATTKVEGLEQHYGVTGDAVQYFRLHGELDVAHASELAKALAGVVTDEDSVAEAEAGARAGAEAIWELLDGVVRERDIAC